VAWSLLDGTNGTTVECSRGLARLRAPRSVRHRASNATIVIQEKNGVKLGHSRVLRDVLGESIDGRGLVPAGPGSNLRLGGTAEAVPFTKSVADLGANGSVHRGTVKPRHQTFGGSAIVGALSVFMKPTSVAGHLSSEEG
jgi:hypothetical protein